MIFTISCLMQLFLQTGNETIGSFEKAKRIARQIYLEHPITMYSNCQYSEVMKILPHLCLFQSPQASSRSIQIEWEHVVPAHRFGQTFPSWIQGHPLCITAQGRHYKGRRCARKVEKTFRFMEADLYNLVPEIGSINLMRSHLPMVFIHEKVSTYGIDGMLVDAIGFQPPQPVRGDIARIYMYMAQAYPSYVRLKDEEIILYHHWHQQDPIEPWECKKHALIQQVQNNGQSYWTTLCTPKHFKNDLANMETQERLE